jgi:two-component system sensor histidine kinase GlrK
MSKGKSLNVKTIKTIEFKKRPNHSSMLNLSIKSLTLLGFSLVALPLVIALLFGASQVNTLSKDSEKAIINVTRLLDNLQLLKSSQIKMERSAAQYLVLRDPVLAENYIEQSQHILSITKKMITAISDEELQQSIKRYTATAIALVDVTIPKAQKKSQNDVDILQPVQQKFNTLSLIYEQISRHSNALNAQYINSIKQAAQATRDIMIQSLVIIPISLFIAALFVFLITTPLKILANSIFRLQQGQFDKEIQLTGSPEIQEIAQALENMRIRLHALELQKSSFIRHISHELKTPLAAIREGTELLYDHSVGELNAEQQEISHIIKNSVFRLQKHIEDLLDFNIVLDSTSLQDGEKILIDDTVAQVLSERKLDLKRKKIQLDLKLNNIYLMSNRKQITVIIDNLLSNAIKYSPNEGVIGISATLTAEQLQLTVSDQGMGISSENQSKIFDAFYQGPPPVDSLVKGSGLGLTIVKELILRLNGKIELLDRQKQQTGTKISIILPRAFQQEEQN